mmetsp:Transcript_46306/g.140433  ORF Transcript_46306/g.140433 Transcript_46306/m.140433 type:complete len:205 (-) Transcript_46306:614-1228(-)
MTKVLGWFAPKAARLPSSDCLNSDTASSFWPNAWSTMAQLFWKRTVHRCVGPSATELLCNAVRRICSASARPPDHCRNSASTSIASSVSVWARPCLSSQAATACRNRPSVSGIGGGATRASDTKWCSEASIAGSANPLTCCIRSILHQVLLTASAAPAERSRVCASTDIWITNTSRAGYCLSPHLLQPTSAKPSNSGVMRSQML